MSAANHLPERYSELLQSGDVTMRTRDVLEARMMRAATAHPHFFNEKRFTTLKVVCARMIPQPSGAKHVDLPGLLDEQVDAGTGKGWRYSDLPPVAEMYCLGLDGCNQSAYAICGAPFHQIPESQQDDLLAAIQKGLAPGDAWQAMSATRFFEELLAAITELYYSHPIAKRLIGDRSFADARGWHFIGLEEQHD